MCAYNILHENVSDYTRVCISVYINSKNTCIHIFDYGWPNTEQILG